MAVFKYVLDIEPEDAAGVVRANGEVVKPPHKHFEAVEIILDRAETEDLDVVRQRMEVLEGILGKIQDPEVHFAISRTMVGRPGPSILPMRSSTREIPDAALRRYVRDDGPL